MTHPRQELSLRHQHVPGVVLYELQGLVDGLENVRKRVRVLPPTTGKGKCSSEAAALRRHGKCSHQHTVIQSAKGESCNDGLQIEQQQATELHHSNYPPTLRSLMVLFECYTHSL